jgi:hypothetical protein
MKKPVIIAIGAVLVLLAGYYIYAGVLNKPNTPPTPGQGNTNTTVTSNGITFQTPRGTVKTKNFTERPITTTESTMVLADSEKYQIVYYPKDKNFVILILAAPATETRREAEGMLLNILGIDKVQACKLPVAVKVPFNVDEKLAGPDYAMSFCSVK